MSRGSAANKLARPGSDEAYHQIFARYADACDPETMSMEGIAAFCEELGIDAATDVIALVLIWRLGGGSKPGCVSKSEFTTGMRALGARTVADLKPRLQLMDPGMLEDKEFREFYKFVFQFSREGTHKTIEKDMITALLPMVLRCDKAPHLQLMLEFLTAGCPASKRITLDQWDSFLLFNRSVRLDLADYDADSAWPVLLDEYVDWRRSNGK